jgi:hypothetical protein
MQSPHGIAGRQVKHPSFGDDLKQPKNRQHSKAAKISLRDTLTMVSEFRQIVAAGCGSPTAARQFVNLGEG